MTITFQGDENQMHNLRALLAISDNNLPEIIESDVPFLKPQAILKKWSYALSTNTIWLNFDCGEVEAETKEEARQLSLDQLKADLAHANRILGSPSAIEINFSELVIEEIVG